MLKKPRVLGAANLCLRHSADLSFFGPRRRTASRMRTRKLPGLCLLASIAGPVWAFLWMVKVGKPRVQIAFFFGSTRVPIRTRGGLVGCASDPQSAFHLAHVTILSWACAGATGLRKHSTGCIRGGSKTRRSGHVKGLEGIVRLRPAWALFGARNPRGGNALSMVFGVFTDYGTFPRKAMAARHARPVMCFIQSLNHKRRKRKTDSTCSV